MKTKGIGVLLIIMGIFAMLASGTLKLYNDWQEVEASAYSDEVSEALLDMIATSSELRSVFDIENVIEARVDGLDVTVINGVSEYLTFNGSGIQGDLPQSGIWEDTDDAEDTGNPDSDRDSNADHSIKYVLIDGVAYIGVLNIPALNLNLPVNCVLDMPALKKTPCRFSGSIYGNNLVIAAHRMKAHFGKLDTLTVGQAVILTDVDGVEHHYIVTGLETVDPSSTEYVIHSDSELTLFTCTYGGRARVIVRCGKVVDENENTNIMETPEKFY